MAAAIFDTHQFVRKLKASGFDERQAEALTEAIRASHESSEVATKHDLAEMKFELLKWVVGLSFAQIGLLIGILMKFM
ncbi:Putative conserved phage protein [Candidatus Glomeribacter gigasporarum BEG34]|uniref:Putative conserved phage protein n=1 Tax=Candidatus Glomeribacter gigasporarum BEG34 TaxID=1070319 RepID=G2J7N5_9BURK|nr:coiled-coil domain-containing protein [Candidatus Glomeribacter gigasporarum]CCD28780.1 Putative conserved phage protein [Candidatus Glomeribacter gigasporarum BEG34]